MFLHFEITCTDDPVVMEEALTLDTPSKQLELVVNGPMDNINKKPEFYRFYLHFYLSTVS
ncbi:hypothetical protein PAEVO_18530 [Paenibacillus sp. GM2FR]|nr:hypothetical protein PAEVO_18530 [Paenibacillus sp. GM2FR]